MDILKILTGFNGKFLWKVKIKKKMKYEYPKWTIFKI
jgi:hypothetical protein